MQRRRRLDVGQILLPSPHQKHLANHFPLTALCYAKNLKDLQTYSRKN
jgi:hypothetical protein